MSNFLHKLNIKDISKEESSSSESLEDLLLVNIADKNAAVLQKPTSTKDSSKSSGSSRKGRRDRLKNKRVVNISGDEDGPSAEQLRLTKEYEEKNKQALLRRQLQANQKSQSGSSSELFQSADPLSKNETAADAGTEILTATMRPIVLGSFQYEPPNAKGHLTPTGELIRLKRSTKRIKLDKIVRPRIQDVTFKVPQIADVLSTYVSAREAFFNSLAPSNLSNYHDILSAFGLELNENVSNSETIYTLLKELAHSVKYATSRLDESADRLVDGDENIVGKKAPLIENYYGALEPWGAPDNFQKLRDADVDDIEISIKCLMSIMSKETIYSYNIGSKELSGPTNVNPHFILQVQFNNNYLTNPPPMQNPAFISAHGIAFTSIKPDGGTLTSTATSNYSYPLELAQVINKDKQTRSAIDFTRELSNDSSEQYPSEVASDATMVDSPYKAISDSFASGNTRLRSLIDSVDLSPERDISIQLLNTILETVHIQMKAAVGSVNTSIECNILRAAAADHNILGWLLIYLTFRFERINGAGSSGDFSKLVTNSKYLRDCIGTIAGGKVEKTFEISPQNVTLNPAVDGQSEFTAPSQETTATLETSPGAGETATLEARFDVTFEGVCDLFALELQNYWSSGANIQNDFTTSQSISVYPTMVSSCLRSTNTSSSIFDFLLSFDQVLESVIPQEQPVSIFTGENRRTRFSQVPRENMLAIFSMATSKLVALLMTPRCNVIAPPIASSTITQVTMTAPPAYSGQQQSARTSRYSYRASSLSDGVYNNNTIQPSQSNLAFQFSTDYSSVLLDIEDYLGSQNDDFSDIAESFPVITSIGASLLQEEKILTDTASSLDTYFEVANKQFEALRSSLDIQLHDGTSLKERIANGLIPTLDSAKLLKSYSHSFNDPMMTYNNSKIKDKTIGPHGTDLMLQHCSNYDPFTKKKNAFVIGIPAGLLEEVSNPPAEIQYIRSNKTDTQPEIFTLTIQKIDQTNPNIDYEDVNISFSRSLFLVGHGRTRQTATPNFITIDKN